MTTESRAGRASVREEKIDAKRHHVPQDDVSLFSDEDSVGSIFSSDDETVEPSSVKKLKIEFKMRDELLDELTKGIDPTFARVMRENEEAVRKKKMLCLNQGQKDTFKPPSSSVQKSVNSKQNIAGSMDRMQRAQCMLQGAIIVLLNCMAYNGGEQIIRAFVVALSEDDEFEDLRLLPACLLLVGLVVLCLGGGIWEWVDNSTYARVKFDMNNRLLARKWDAVLMKWLRQHEPAYTSLNVLAFFSVQYVVFTFQEQFCLGLLTFVINSFTVYPVSNKGFLHPWVSSLPCNWMRMISRVCLVM